MPRAQKNGRADFRSDHKIVLHAEPIYRVRSPIISMSFEQHGHLEIDTHGILVMTVTI